MMSISHNLCAVSPQKGRLMVLSKDMETAPPQMLVRESMVGRELMDVDGIYIYTPNG